MYAVQRFARDDEPPKKKTNKYRMKQIVYNRGWIDPNTPFAEIVDEGSYKGVHYVCVNRGCHPCAYVFCEQSFLDKHSTEYDGLDCIHVHGGVTFRGVPNKLAGMQDYNDPCFGWDYGHAGDWAGYLTEEANMLSQNHKYRTEDVVMEVHSAIDQYLDALKADSEEEMSEDHNLTPEVLKGIGFKSYIEGDDTAFSMKGVEADKKWRIFIDLKHPAKTYAYNESSKRRYEGCINTLSELQKVADLCQIPLEV